MIDNESKRPLLQRALDAGEEQFATLHLTVSVHKGTEETISNDDAYEPGYDYLAIRDASCDGITIDGDVNSPVVIDDVIYEDIDPDGLLPDVVADAVRSALNPAADASTHRRVLHGTGHGDVDDNVQHAMDAIMRHLHEGRHGKDSVTTVVTEGDAIVTRVHHLQPGEDWMMSDLLAVVEDECGKSPARDAFWYLIDSGRIQLAPDGGFKFFVKAVDETSAGTTVLQEEN